MTGKAHMEEALTQNPLEMSYKQVNVQKEGLKKMLSKLP